MLIRLHKADNGVSIIRQISEVATKLLTEENAELAEFFKIKIADPTVSAEAKTKIRLRLDNTTDEKRIEEESMRYALWLDPTRCSSSSLMSF